MILATGDTHRNIDISKIFDLKCDIKAGLPIKYLLITGDFGGVWETDFKDQKFIKSVYGDLGCTVIFVDGNHENFDLLNKYSTTKWNGAKVSFITNNVIHLHRGEIISLDGVKIFGFGGAMSTDRGYGTSFKRSWWKEELPTTKDIENAKYNLSKFNNTVDIILTHDAPDSILYKMNITRNYNDFNRDVEAEFKNFLETIKNKVSFKNWYFGHHHKNAHLQHDNKSYNVLYNSMLNFFKLGDYIL